MAGNLIHRSVLQEGEKEIPVSSGLYIVKIKDRAEKVFVKN
jgi:hypothetical protein